MLRKLDSVSSLSSEQTRTISLPERHASGRTLKIPQADGDGKKRIS